MPLIEISKRPSLRTQITERLFDAILGGELSPGERLVETKLARQLRVGQSTLREALQTLEHQGLITKLDNRGTFVTKLTAKDVEDMYAVRLELEPMAAVLTHKRLQPHHLADLERMVDEMEVERERRNFTELLKKDFAFHQLIWKLSDNPSLEKALSLVCAPLFACYMIRFSPRAPENDLSKAAAEFAEDHGLHRHLLGVLKSDDSELVRTTFRNTIQGFFRSTIEDLSDFGQVGSMASEDASAASR